MIDWTIISVVAGMIVGNYLYAATKTGDYADAFRISFFQTLVAIFYIITKLIHS